MLRWTDLSQIPQGYGPSVVTMGNFDGVHKGHRAVLATVMERARHYGSEGSDGAHAVAVTFDPHPVAVLHPSGRHRSSPRLSSASTCSRPPGWTPCWSWSSPAICEVVHGDHRGRELGYPTANLSQESEGLIPADGVYVGWLIRPTLPERDPDRALPAAISIGTNPTFEGMQRRVEAYVLDRTDLDLYGETVVVEFIERLRPTEKFDSIEDLLLQIADDVARARTVLSSIVR